MTAPYISVVIPTYNRARYIGEAVEKDSFLKSPYFRPLGYPNGVYRVGPLARVNICQHMGVPQADQEKVILKIAAP